MVELDAAGIPLSEVAEEVLKSAVDEAEAPWCGGGLCIPDGFIRDDKGKQISASLNTHSLDILLYNVFHIISFFLFDPLAKIL